MRGLAFNFEQLSLINVDVSDILFPDMIETVEKRISWNFNTSRTSGSEELGGEGKIPSYLPYGARTLELILVFAKP